MKKIIALSLTSIAIAAAPAMAQAVKAKPGNCAIWLEEASKTVAADTRFEGETKTEVKDAFDRFAKAQRKIVADGMAKTYADSKAFGWDKSKVDEMMVANEVAVRKGFKTSTMEDGKLYMDHILAINNCAEANPLDSQYGMSREAFVAALTKAYNIVRAG